MTEIHLLISGIIQFDAGLMKSIDYLIIAMGKTFNIFDAPYYSINREERNLAAIFYYALLINDNLKGFLNKLNFPVEKEMAQRLRQNEEIFIRLSGLR